MPHILVVEDNDAISRGVKSYLSAQGHRVTVAHTKAEAEEIAAADPPALLLVDIALPDGNGMDVLRAQRERGRNVPAIIMTGHEAYLGPVLPGVAAVLAKPFSLGELGERVSRLLGDNTHD